MTSFWVIIEWQKQRPWHSLSLQFVFPATQIQKEALQFAWYVWGVKPPNSHTIINGDGKFAVVFLVDMRTQLNTVDNLQVVIIDAFIELLINII